MQFVLFKEVTFLAKTAGGKFRLEKMGVCQIFPSLYHSGIRYVPLYKECTVNGDNARTVIKKCPHLQTSLFLSFLLEKLTRRVYFFAKSKMFVTFKIVSGETLDNT